ncbi:D-aminoacyl-tRNA deacylase 1-like isoform X1 [Macrosteles quadrilineatus]|uniref:D-aminoacyl-tRNA deacylase 1-like isoform X1 n=1 Tax=Macrosteles quadrilineatus TaxID=74068 RepID=UPI0023E23B90|nr:D-aminoacyl-tRNA deacylase 1-like isoform X1 [Macrosteles quadrilineatus]
MKVVIQKVTSASVSVGEEVISSIGRGLCVLVGISKEDTEKEIDYLVRKVLNIRLFGDDERKWASNVVDQGLEVLCLSQITLYTSLKGNKMDFHNAMSPSHSQPLYQQFLDKMRQQYLPDKVKEGRFGATCVVSINNDGPVTVILDSPQSKKQPIGDD